jgi:LuxR family transcriptional regulator, maltose regulon positive regulatory protein
MGRTRPGGIRGRHRLPAPGSLAADLFVTLNTLKTHLRAIYRKLGGESREEAVIRAREGGLI